MERLEAAAQERGAFQSELFRRAVRFYINENPDDIRAFTEVAAQDSPDSGGSASSAKEPEADLGASVYDPTEGR